MATNTANIFQFPHRGKTVTVISDNTPDGHKISFEQDGIVHEYYIVCPIPNFQGHEIVIHVLYIAKTISGSEIKSENRAFSVDKKHWDFYYNLSIAGKLGECLSRSSINAVLYELMQANCFTTENVFYQPVTFDTFTDEVKDAEGNITSLNLRVEAIDGTGPFQYSLDGVLWQTDNIFPAISQQSYVVYMKDSLGVQDYFTHTT
jgi:guanyl-specific ribonuclease Sa